MVENDEIAHFEQFHLFHNVFLKFFFFNVLKRVYMEERVKNTSMVICPLDTKKKLVQILRQTLSDSNDRDIIKCKSFCTKTIQMTLAGLAMW